MSRGVLKEPWCGTCGKTVSPQEHLENDGDCDKCYEWWIDQHDLWGD